MNQLAKKKEEQDPGDEVRRNQPSIPSPSSKGKEGCAPASQQQCPRENRGRVVGLDCHPDILTASIYTGNTAARAVRLSTHQDIPIEQFETWCTKHLEEGDLVVMEAGSNSFELADRLDRMGYGAVVLESCQVGRLAESYMDSDVEASKRIALAYLTGLAKVVWVPDEATRERRELLHHYNNAVTDETRAVNSCKSQLNGYGLRLKKRNPKNVKTLQWVLEQREWSSVQRAMIEELFAQLQQASARRQRYYKMMAREIYENQTMLRLLNLLGIGLVNAFALLAIIGDIRRFATSRKLVTYLGLNPGRKKSGMSKDRKVGIGNRGRKDMRNLIIQGAHAVLRKGRDSELSRWGWKIFARKGNRNVAVVAVARKMVVQVWYVLNGRSNQLTEQSKSLKTKVGKLGTTLGKKLRKELGYETAQKFIDQVITRILQPMEPTLPKQIEI